jgi:hypothetical protein
MLADNVRLSLRSCGACVVLILAIMAAGATPALADLELTHG